MEVPIVNRVAQSSLMTIDLTDFTVSESEIELYSLRQHLESGLLREQPFRKALRSVNWQGYAGKSIAIPPECEAIIPQWAYMLVVSYLTPYVKAVAVGSKGDLQKKSVSSNESQP